MDLSRMLQAHRVHNYLISLSGLENYGRCPAGNHVKDSNKPEFQQQLDKAPASYFGYVLRLVGGPDI